MIKTFLKTTAAVVTLIAGSQVWGGDLEIASISSSGALGTGHITATSAAASVVGVVVAPEKNAVIAQTGAAVVQTSGGIVCPGKTLTLDIAATASTIFNIVAIQDLNLFIRATTKGTPIAALTISNLILGEKASTVKVWTSEITALTLSAVQKDARFDRGLDASVTSVDIPTTAPTTTVGGRLYTLVKHYSTR